MPRYKSHKLVWALKIAAIALDSVAAQAANRETDGSAIITPADPGFAPFRVEHDYVQKHKPEIGGYYVVYSDGYKSFSPAKAFEEGYTPLTTTPQPIEYAALQLENELLKKRVAVLDWIKANVGNIDFHINVPEGILCTNPWIAVGDNFESAIEKAMEEFAQATQPK